MPYSFTKIEEDKTKTIGFVFFFLIGFYFLTFWFIAVCLMNYYHYQMAMEYTGYADTYRATNFHFSFSLGLIPTVGLLLTALVVGAAHWLFTAHNIINKILRVLGAEPINPTDRYHQVFQNIINEVSVATGGTKMRGVVIPTMAMNAFALADFQGDAVIGVTEGMLARLNRAQLEAVVGHEAAHIVSGDCLTTTITSSVFELYGGLLRGVEFMLRGDGRRSYSYSRGRDQGTGVIMVGLILVYVLLFTTRLLSQMLHLFISREREHRADAIAVRLTRDPLSLAQALYGIAYHWRGSGLPAQELSAIFIINPQLSSLDEQSGFLPDLFSTHPPVDQRLKILLDMAHGDAKALEQAVTKIDQRPRQQVPQVSGGTGNQDHWMLHKDGQWQGPFPLDKIIGFDWIRPDTWVQKIGEGKVKMAQEEPLISQKVYGKQADNAPLTADSCPRCQRPLVAVDYEGVQIEKCPFCQGTLVSEKDVQRLILRREVGFSEKIQRLVEGFKKQQEANFVRPKIDPQTLYPCVKCRDGKSRMLRMFYTAAYPVEVDKCVHCGSLWFDPDELEALQYLIESNTQKK